VTQGRGWRTGGLARVDISPADIGRRVTIRHRLSSGQLTDVVGLLESWRSRDSEGSPLTRSALTVRNRHGISIEVEPRAMVAARVVAPEASAYDMQRLSEQGWAAVESQPLGDWVLRSAHGVTGRANSARVAGDPGMSTADALECVVQWYGGRGLTPRLQVPETTDREDTFTAQGWFVDRRTRFLVADSAAVAAHERSTASEVVIERLEAPSDEWMSVLADESRDTWPILRSILTSPTEVTLVAARDKSTGLTLGVGRASASTSRIAGSRWAGLTNIHTVPSARRRGIATVVIAELATWALSLGCQRTYVQVLDDDDANALYSKLSFEYHHTYGYWVPSEGVRP